MKNRTEYEAPAPRARGFSIVEALVALVVLSVGMLGIAALYVESLRAGRSAIYRTHAVNLASDLADRIRANRTAGAAYARAVDVEPAANDCAPTVSTASSACTPDELAEDDLARWLEAIRLQLPGDGTDALPNGTVQVAPAAAATNSYTIEITWSEPGEQRPLTYVLNLQI